MPDVPLPVCPLPLSPAPCDRPWCSQPGVPLPGVPSPCDPPSRVLQAQLQCCLAKQAEVLLQGKRQTAGSPHSLQRQLQVLDDLVSSTATDSLFLPSSSTLGSLHSALNVTKAQVMFC